MLDERGRFWNGPLPIDHAGMATAFATWIRRHPDDGRYILTNGYDWTYFTVEGTPYFVRHVEISEKDGKRNATLLLSDDTEEPLDPASVTADDEGLLYARVKGGAYDARFLPVAQSAMVDLVEESDEGQPCVVLGEERHAIGAR